MAPDSLFMVGVPSCPPCASSTFPGGGGVLPPRRPAFPGSLVESTGTGDCHHRLRCPVPRREPVGEARHPRGAGDSRSGRPLGAEVGRIFASESGDTRRYRHVTPNTGVPAPVAAASVAGRRRGTPNNLGTSCPSDPAGACHPPPVGSGEQGVPGLTVHGSVGCDTRDALPDLT